MSYRLRGFLGGTGHFLRIGNGIEVRDGGSRSAEGGLAVFSHYWDDRGGSSAAVPSGKDH